jgi:hypothetical protein
MQWFGVNNFQWIGTWYPPHPAPGSCRSKCGLLLGHTASAQSIGPALRRGTCTGGLVLCAHYFKILNFIFKFVFDVKLGGASLVEEPWSLNSPYLLPFAVCLPPWTAAPQPPDGHCCLFWWALTPVKSSTVSPCAKEPDLKKTKAKYMVIDTYRECKRKKLPFKHGASIVVLHWAS